MHSYKSISIIGEAQKQKLITRFIILISVFFLIFSLYNFYKQNLAFGIINLSMLIIQIIMLFVSQRGKNHRLLRLDMVLLALNFYYNFAQGMTRPEYALWVAVSPLAIYIFFEKKEAAIWSLLYLFGLVCLVTRFILHGGQPDPGLLGRLLAVYLLIFLIMYNMDIVRNLLMSGIEKYEKQLIDERNRAEEAREKAENADHFKSRFMAVMSHEIRNPLSVIIGVADLMSPGSPRNHEYCMMIRDTSAHLNALINNILDFSRMEEGKIELNENDFRPKEMMASLEKIHRVTLREKNIRFAVSADPAVPDILRGDVMRIRQVITNLLDNARKFTERGSIDLEISLADRPDPGHVTLAISVKDTGIGIPEGQVDSIFDAYEQVHRNTLPTTGAGLGLTICRKIIDEMNGSISVKSRSGCGSEFTVSLTLAIPPSLEIPAGGEIAETTGRNRYSILMAEDNTAVRLFISIALTNQGHRVTEAGNGEEVISLLREGRYDCVLMDIEMPVMDGLKASMLIRQGEAGEANRRIPIVALSGYADTKDPALQDRSIISDFIQKPVNVKSLLAAIDSNIARVTETNLQS